MWGKGRGKGGREVTNEEQEIFEDDGGIYYLNCADGFTGGYVSQDLSNCSLYICEFIVRQLYLNKAVNKDKLSNKNVTLLEQLWHTSLCRPLWTW